jgi:shikimate kinase
MSNATIVLVGFMGCGKSSVARVLEERLHIPAIDLDDVIESRVGTTIAQVFAERGEEEFRKLETETLRSVLLDESSGQILATGGGVVTREENRKVLREARERGVRVVYLEAEPKTLARRIRRQPGLRPLIDGERILNRRETEERVQSLLEKRSPWYHEVAGMILSSDRMTPDEIAEQIQFSVLANTTIINT